MVPLTVEAETISFFSFPTFADDLIIVVRRENQEILTTRCNEAISKLVTWGKSHKLHFNASKTICMPLSYGGRLQRNEPLQIFLEGHPVSIQDQIVSLGVTWDSAHFHTAFTSVAENFYWRHNGMFKRIYTGAIEPFMLYGHGAWGHRSHLKTVDRILNGIQRRPLIKVTRAFRTTSTDALQVIAGLLPLTLKAVEVYTKFLILTVKVNATVGTQEILWHEVEMKEDLYARYPADWISIPFGMETPTGEDIEIFTDGSKIENRVGG
ncbi:hypothetical protein AVEN_221498-1 [Araneus ventricosus]|uniref:Reverse transcriptase domain-containing protein n=1 Tax=Araneus ventricosus TaxID=182803 RepID=A0A4Y2DZY2_ARAVE|nr:hypothetical protein AVEN_221498-1 [Araneus ventricosus]